MDYVKGKIHNIKTIVLKVNQLKITKGREITKG